VIATAVTGLYLGRCGSRMMGPDARLTGRAVWETLTFLINGFVFIATGLEVPAVLRTLDSSTALRLIGIGAAVTLALIVVRAAWIFAAAALPRALGHARSDGDGAAQSLVLSWAGMRGVVSLAAALALPYTFADGRPFPARDALLVVTMTVIVLTLVGQGLTLPWLIRRLRLATDVQAHEEEANARRQLVEAATRRIDQLYPVWPGHHPLLDQLRGTYQHRSEHVERQHEPGGDGEDRELIEHREIRRTVIDAEREALLRLRAEDAIDDDVLRKLERELDLEEQRMDA
jgi:CPA1 family monovalent cation:H+ antiporter